MYQRILIATDGSELSEKAVQSGLELARLARSAVIALKVVPHYPRSYFDGGSVIEPSEIKRVEEHWNKEAQTLVEGVKARGLSEGLSVMALIVKSDLIAEAIIEAAKKHQCDLIVMASHGRKGIKRMLLGSETQHVLTHSHIPVLVLR
ncbi:Nucleotide-binding universal stress protein, UspA family [Oryzisolibacter propanilivorax]|uniref:Nucleotide-binding universal stress protein, UspA family n=1 Tax=Oryzisolibacter propanilivorax TaxID=1527607 RepID=A0A1G9P1U6_9BURK|nr:universal stress protein [Oryzisolibacter propanilivorax]SDL92145.1 Nucleotide-binding universal stress protein, UspA family [Oryzisolibacter propanilivorax]